MCLNQAEGVVRVASQCIDLYYMVVYEITVFVLIIIAPKKLIQVFQWRTNRTKTKIIISPVWLLY